MTSLAHGRVNLIGEHTDYNGGWVLPTLIPQKTMVRLNSRSDQEVTAVSTLEAGVKTYTLGQEKKSNQWIDYVQGLTSILRRRGLKLGGFDLQVESNLPAGSGLSSSAALEISVLRALNETFELGLSSLEMAKIGQQCENEFVGAPVGIMDQMVVSGGLFGSALFLDTLNLTSQLVRLPLDKMDLVIINSGFSHCLSETDGGYIQRKNECEAACKSLSVKQLRELSIDDLPAVERLPETLKRRARHVITENQRVHEAVKAFKAEDLSGVGELFYASHLSMKDDYNVSIQPIDLLVQLFRKESATFGARLTGGGFGGSVVALVKKGFGGSVSRAVLDAYKIETGGKGSIVL